MARRRRGGSLKNARQTRKGKKNEKVNGILDDSNCLMDADSPNGVGEGHGIGAVENECAGNGEPVVHHKKFGKIRMSNQNENSQDIETSTSETSKDYSRFDSKSSDENDLEPLESSRFTSDVGVISFMRGIEISEEKVRTSYNDFCKQSSVYKVENDIPLDGSVIIKPGTFSSNTISSSVKSNLFFDSSSTSELNSVNFLKVLQGIEMLERNVSSSLEFGRAMTKQDKDFVMTSAPHPTVYLNEESDNEQCKNIFSIDESHFNNLKTYGEDLNEIVVKSEVEDIVKSPGSSPYDTSSDIQNDTDEAASKLQNIVLDDRRDASDSPASKGSDEVADKKANVSKNHVEGNVESESSANGGAPIRRSNRIRTIGMMKQKEREQAAGKADCAIKSPLPPNSPAVTPPMVGLEEKPVKVKSRWRRSSELEMHSGKVVHDPEAISSNCSSPVNPSQAALSLTPTPSELTPEDLERLEREKKEIEEGLNSFTILTENEYKTERNACKETRRMVCDCVLTKEEIMRGEAGCGEDCLNRMLFLECGPRCALGDRCTNKRFQKLQYAHCRIFKTEKKGFGLRAEEDLAGNTFIMEYVGEVVDQKEFARRVKMYAKDNNKHFYFMALKGDAIIDATNKGNISRFINHSCEPNAETQKWTINGELRVGFFTRRSIRAGEEITFDYQFQRYGKQAQKCYCEASTCRGWIGENPDESVEDDEEEEDEEEEDEEELEDDEIKESRKAIKIDGEKEKKEELTKAAKSADIKGKKEKKKNLEKKKERKATTIVDDMGLDEEIQKLFQTGLKNRAHTLTLSRLMVRAEDWSTRGKLLKLIREGETPCRRLFLDYHGLRLICSWMVSRELEESSDKNERRLEILKTLSKLPIPNKNMLIDSKVLSVVEQWSKSGNVIRKLSVDEETGVEENKKPKLEGLIPGLGGDGDEKPTPEREKIEGLNSEGDEESTEKMKRMAEVVLETWASLKEVFKIPKKERIEQMKEHERQADRGYIEYLDNKENFRDKYDRHDRHDRYGRSDRYRNDRERDRDRIRDRKRTRDSPPDPEWFRNHERNSKMTKHERRQLFALKVLQEDEEAKKRSEHIEMWKQHESRCLALGLDPNLNAACDPQTGFPVFFDHGTSTWQNCPPSSGPSPSMSHTSSVCPSPMYPVGPPMMQNCQNCPMCTSIPPVCSSINGNVSHNGIMHSNPMSLTNGSIPLPSCPGQSYANITPQYQPSIPRQNFETVAPSYENSVSPENLPPLFEETISNELSKPFITEVPLNVPIKLPPKWKSAKDAKGRVYYYHVKERVSQWEPPQWSEEDAKKEAARTVALEMGDSSSSTESSTETSSDDEDEEAENVTAGALKQTNSPGEIRVNCMGTKESKEGDTLYDSSRRASEECLDGKMLSEVTQWLEDEKDEDLSAWEEEEEAVKSSKAVEEKVASSTPNEERTPAIPLIVSAAPPVRVRRAGLVQEIIISPRREEDRVDNRRYKEVKEMLRKQKEEARVKLRSKGEKGTVRLSRSKRKKKEKPGRSSSRPKPEKLSSAISESSTDRKIKENFKNSMAGAIVSHLNPYRKQDCKVGRITCNEDFKHLARKLTHFVMLKELKHCKGVDDLECNDSVKAKAKDFIKKYMAKFGAVYQRPQHEIGKT